MSDVIASILTDASMRSTAVVEKSLMQSAKAGGAWAAKEA
jgi:hypothetical protein